MTTTTPTWWSMEKWRINPPIYRLRHGAPAEMIVENVPREAYQQALQDGLLNPPTFWIWGGHAQNYLGNIYHGNFLRLWRDGWIYPR